MAFEADLNQKAADLRAAGFDPGPAISGVITFGLGAYRLHQAAVLTTHPTAGVHEVHGLIMDRYFNRMGGPASFLGFPTSDELIAGVGRFNRFEFQGSFITWHPVFGVHEVHGLIGDYFAATLGGANGPWGFPVSDEYPDGAAGRSSDFEGGTLNWTPTDGIIEVLAATPGSVIPAAGDWPRTNTDDRLRYVMHQLVERYGFPMNGAAGIVGNLWAESAVIPSRIEGSAEATPMRAKDFSGASRDFTAQEIMARRQPLGPLLPGVGLAQWTSGTRRAGTFTHVYNGMAWGVNALFSMDDQVDYLVSELRSGFPGVNLVVSNPATSVDTASDEVVYNFEVPGAILENGNKLPRSDPRVQAVFAARRKPSARARADFP
jgi:hypothetical protein